MDISALIGVAIAIVCILIVVRIGLMLAAKFGWASDILTAIVWGAATILCILLIASAFGINVPWVHW